MSDITIDRRADRSSRSLAILEYQFTMLIERYQCARASQSAADRDADFDGRER